MKERMVACPTCRAGAAYSESNRWRPFCSERCRGADLGAWASERYRVATPAPADDGSHGLDALDAPRSLGRPAD